MTLVDSFILIGGKSSRLGTDKAFVDLGGMTLIQRAIESVRMGLPETRITMVAGSSTQFAIEAISSDVPFIFDLYEARGPLGGLHAALAYAKSPWIFVLACDYPFVSPELISLLSKNISSDYGAIVPEQNDGRLQPLCAFYHTATARHFVEEILDRPRLPPPMREVVAQMDPRVVKFGEYSHLAGADTFFININTEADLTEARKITRKLSGRN